MVLQQMKAVFEELPPRAAKTGMLFSVEIIRTVATFWKNKNRIPLIVDPVMISTSGKALLKESAMNALKNDLLPLATLVTPNVPEAEALLGKKIRTPEDLRSAAREIKAQFGCAALLKGGHLPEVDEAMDIFFDGKTELLLSAPFVKNVSTHGTGCVYSAAITGNLALGHDLPSAVQYAKVFVTTAIANSNRISKHFVLHFSRK
jgi:hydroxymethylpyrimidine/phosphomethylpyrimidine kinase